MEVSIELSTLVIAVFTIALAIFSLWQTMITRSAARQQVRAYIGIQAACIKIQDNYTLATVHIEYINTGQSPAYDLSTWIKIKIDVPTASPFAEELAIQDRTGSSVCVPGASAHSSLTLRFSWQELEELRTRKKALFIWGGADYRDAFNKKRHFKIRATAGISMEETWSVVPHKVGYIAN